MNLKSTLRGKFWIGMGVAALVALLLSLLLVLPVWLKNNKTLRTLKDRAGKLEKYRRDGVKNASYVAQEQQCREAYEAQLTEVEQELTQLDDSVLERYFDYYEDGKLIAEGPLAFGNWRDVYWQNMRGLRMALEDAVVVVTSEEPLYEAPLGADWLAQDVMHEEEKRYWIQKEIVDAISDLNAAGQLVPAFDSFAFTEKAERCMHESHKGQLFKCIPFELTVGMELVKAPELLHGLLKSPLELEITSVSMASRGKGVPERERPRGDIRRPILPRQMEGPARLGAPGSALAPTVGVWPLGTETTGWPRPTEVAPVVEDTERALPHDMVTVAVRGYVPDYRQPKEQMPGGTDTIARSP